MDLLQNGCHITFVGIHVHKTCKFDGRLQAGKQEEVRRSQIRVTRRVIKHSYHLLSQELSHTDCIVHRYYHEASSIFQPCVTLVEHAGYAVAIRYKTAW